MSNSSPQRELSQEIRDYLLSDEVFDQYERIAVEHTLDPDEATDTFSEAIYRFMTGMDSLQEMETFIGSGLLLENTVVKAVISSLLLRVISQVTKDVPNSAQEILAWSQQAQSPGEHMSPLMFVRFFINSFADRVASQDQHRLETILLSYVTAERTQEQTIAFLKRSHKVGGLEMTEETANELIQSLDVQRASVSLDEEQSEPEVKEVAVSSETQKTTSPEESEGIHSSVASVQRKKDTQDQKDATNASLPTRLDTFSEEDAKEIEQMNPSSPSLAQQMVGLVPEEQVRRICSQDVFAFSDPEQKKRCVDIVNSRVREVRDVYQTRDALEKPLELGGLGITGRRLADMMELIEQVMDRNQTQQKDHVEQTRVVAFKQKETVQQEKSELAQKEAQILSKKYVHTTGKLPTESVEPTAPSLSRASVALSSHLQQQQQEAKIDVDKVRKVIQASKESPKQMPVSKPRVQDVKAVPRLLGPVEELQSMGLQQFRRLSKDPQQAADRVRDMIELLADQGYTKRVEGLKAFQSSPLMKLYVSVTKQALTSGKIVDEILAQEPEHLTKQEYQLLMKLNADMRL